MSRSRRKPVVSMTGAPSEKSCKKQYNRKIRRKEKLALSSGDINMPKRVKSGSYDFAKDGKYYVTKDDDFWYSEKLTRK